MGADEIRRRLDWQVGILNPKGYKPKGMHWKTYHRLTVDHDNNMNQSLMGIMAKLKINNRLNNF
jgi:hypothetical protein